MEHKIWVGSVRLLPFCLGTSNGSNPKEKILVYLFKEAPDGKK